MHTQSSTPHRAAVITRDRVFFGDGNLGAGQGLGRDLIRILDGCRRSFAMHCTVVVDDVTVAELADQSDAAKAAGWAHTQIGAWTVFHRTDGRTVALGIRQAMDTPHLGVLFDRDTDPGVIAVLLDRYYRITGNPWRGTCATTALNAIRLSWENGHSKPLWNAPNISVRSGAGPMTWQRDLSETEASWGWVHTFDANAAYLGAASNANLAWSQLAHTGPQPFDKGLPGYWLVELSTATLEALNHPSRPPVLDQVKDGQVWVTTPYAQLLGELGDRLDIADSWTGQPLERYGRVLHGPQARVLQKWATQLRDARAQLDTWPGGGLRDTLRHAVGRTYKDAIGGMQREGMRIFRPDWADTVIDLWRATLYRRMARVHASEGIWPVRVATDSISYADCTDSPDTLGKAIGIGTGLGFYKHEASVTTAEWLSRGAR